MEFMHRIRISYRWKLFAILLVASLAPLMTMRSVVSNRGESAVKKTANQTRIELLRMLGHELELNAIHAAENLDAQGTSIKLVTRLLARDTGRALKGRLKQRPKGRRSPGPSGPYTRSTRMGKVKPLPIDMDKIGFHYSWGADRAALKDKEANLNDMLSVMQGTYRDLGEGVLWLQVALKSGITATYPAPSHYPLHYDALRTEWFKKADVKEGGDMRWTMPATDALTRSPVGIYTHPLKNSEGKIVGAVSCTVRLSAILQEARIAEQWTKEVRVFLVYSGMKGEDGNPIMDGMTKGKEGLLILGKQNYDQKKRGWMMRPEAEWLVSDNATDFKQFLDKVNTSTSGRMHLSFKGRDSMWAFAAFSGIAYIIIVPESVISALPDSTAKAMQDTFFRIQTYALYGAAAAVLMAALFAWRWARRDSKPILALSSAAKKLGEGDFDARVDMTTNDERDDLIRIFNEVGPNLRERLKFKEDLELASEVQELLLPKQAPEIEGIDAAGGIVYCDQTGGDYFDFIQVRRPTNEPAHAVIVGDVSGHGVQAALLMATARALLHGLSGASMSLDRRIEHVNNRLCDDLDGSGRFMTLFYLQVEEAGARLRWIRAGHDPALYYDPDHDTFSELRGDGIALGVVPDMNFEVSVTSFSPGDVVVLATDGVWEAHNSDGEMFGKDRYLQTIRESAHLPAEGIRDAIFHAVQTFAPDAGEDDITVVVLKRT